MGPLKILLGFALMFLGGFVGLLALGLAAQGSKPIIFIGAVFGMASLTLFVVGARLLRRPTSPRPRRDVPATKRKGFADDFDEDEGFEAEVMKALGGTTSQSWRDGPATWKQKSFADDLGIDYPPNIGKGDLSDLIDKHLGRDRRKPAR